MTNDPLYPAGRGQDEPTKLGPPTREACTNFGIPSAADHHAEESRIAAALDRMDEQNNLATR